MYEYNVSQVFFAGHDKPLGSFVSLARPTPVRAAGMVPGGPGLRVGLSRPICDDPGCESDTDCYCFFCTGCAHVLAVVLTKNADLVCGTLLPPCGRAEALQGVLASYFRTGASTLAL